MFRKLMSLFAAAKPAAPRSPLWPKARAEHLKREPRCVACARKDSLIVHHILPYHLYPELELVEGNFLTACEPPGGGCHLLLMHLGSYAAFNPDARRDAAAHLEKVRTRPTKRLA